jgi:uncharacterized membrane protein
MENTVQLVTEKKAENGRSSPRAHGLVLLVIFTNVFGNVFLSHGMHQVGRLISASPFAYLRAFANPWTACGMVILVGWMLSDLALLSRADLSFVLPVTASAYVLVALLGHFLLHDHISWERWIGILLITGGVVLAEETPSRTTKGPPERLLPKIRERAR